MRKVERERWGGELSLLNLFIFYANNNACIYLKPLCFKYVFMCGGEHVCDTASESGRQHQHVLSMFVWAVEHVYDTANEAGRQHQYPLDLDLLVVVIPDIGNGH